MEHKYGCENCKKKDVCEPNPFGICKYYDAENEVKDNHDDYNEKI